MPRTYPDIWQSICAKWLSRGQHRYGVVVSWGVLHGVYISVTWLIQMDRQCAAAMLPYINDFDHLLLFCCHSWAALQYYVRRCGMFLSVCHVREPCNRLTVRDTIWVVDLGGFEGACIRWGWILAPRGKYKWTVHVRQQCGLSVKLAATLRGSRPGVQSASLIMTSLMTS